MNPNPCRVRILTADEKQRAVIAGILAFSGIHNEEPAELVLLHAPYVGNQPALNLPAIVVGSYDPLSVAPTVNIPTLTYHNLQSALRELQQLQAAREEQVSEAAGQLIVGDSANIRTIRNLVTQVAERETTVLVTGQSGSGKEVVARAIHESSPRSQGPFVPVNCGAIPGDLLESELFGHERGAFTGAVAGKKGRFELAAGGTLFLDEVGDMPFDMQVKLLRALETGQFERLGGTQTLTSDVRVVAATHQNLEQMIAEGRFREDLYYRLNVFPIELKPLHSRVDDIEPLVSAFAAQIEQEHGVSLNMSNGVLEALQSYSWPGNVRELKNLLERLAVQFPNQVITSAELPSKYANGAANGTDHFAVEEALPAESGELDTSGQNVRLPINGIDLKAFLTGLERQLIEQALADTNAVVARAADRLHIRRTTLVEKMRKYGITRA